MGKPTCKNEVSELLEYFVQKFKKANNTLSYRAHIEPLLWRPQYASDKWFHDGAGIIIEGGKLSSPITISLNEAGEISIQETKMLDDCAVFSMSDKTWFLGQPDSIKEIEEYVISLISKL